MKIEKFLETSPLFASYQLSEYFFGPFQKKLKKEGVTFLQSLILIALFVEKRAVSPSKISKTFGTTRSNISHALKRLLNKGLIRREVNQEDARKFEMSLTSLGKKKVSRLIKTYDLLQEAMEEDFGERKILIWTQSAFKIVKKYGEQ